MLQLGRPVDTHYPVDARHHGIVHRMLELTRPTQTWRAYVLFLLSESIMEHDLKHSLSFLQHVLSAGKLCLTSRQCNNHQSSRARQQSYLHIDFTRAPRMLNVDRWKNLLITLGFEIDSPDGYHNLDDVSVASSDGVLLPALEGMNLLISFLLDMPWDLLRMVSRLSQSDACGLRYLMESADTELQQQETARSLLSRFPDEMKTLGFHGDRHCVKRTPLSLQQSQTCRKLALVLIALFQEDPPSLGTFI